MRELTYTAGPLRVLRALRGSNTGSRL